jgi:oligopeptide transport system substrate-binding protein
MSKTLVTTISIVLVLISCNKQEQDFDRKILNQQSGPITHLDPQVATGLAASLQLAKVYESLYEIHPFKAPYEILPSLAVGKPKISKDEKTYTFKINTSAAYQESKCLTKGRTVKADDFVTTFKRIADKKILSPHFSYWNKFIVGLDQYREESGQTTNYNLSISGVKALSDDTLEITLKTRNKDFLYLLTSPTTAPIPREAISCLNNDLSKQTIATGPYILKKYVRGSKLKFIKNKNYRHKLFPDSSHPEFSTYIKNYSGKKVPIIDEINVKIIKESQTAWLNFMKGKLDYLEVPKDNFTQVFTPSVTVSDEIKNKGITVGAGPADTNLSYFAINQNHPILKNKKVRQAMSLAFDRQEYNKLFFNNSAVLASSMLPPGIRGNTPAYDCKNLDYDIEKAKKLLSESGHSNIKISMMVKNKNISRQVAEYFKKQMSKVGIEVKINTVSWQVLLGEAQKGKYDMFYLSWYVGLPKGNEFFELIYGPNHPGSYNRVAYHNSKFDELFNKAQLSTDLVEEKQHVIAMNEIACEDLPLIPLVHTKNFFVRHGWLKNYVPSDQFGGLEQYYDIDLGQKKEGLKKL